MKLFLFLLIFVFAPGVTVVSQNWEIDWEKHSTFNNQDYFIDVAEAENGDFVVLGECGANQSADFWLLRFNATGDTLWTRRFGSTDRDEPEKVSCLFNGDILVLGRIISEVDEKVKLIRTNSLGNVIWEKTLGNDAVYKANDIIPLLDNSFIIVGSKGTGPETPRLWMAKMDENGNLVWEQTYLANQKGCFTSIKQMPNSEFILSGQVSGKALNDCDIVLFRTDEMGKEIWQNRMEESKTKEWPECVCCSPDSCFMLVGWMGKCFGDLNDENPVFDYDLMIKKINCDGKIQWSKNIDSEGSEGGNAVTIRPDGKFLVAGAKITSFTGTVGPWLLEVDKAGNIVDEILLNARLDQASKILTTSDGGFVLVGPGWHEQLNRYSNGWILKFSGK